MQEIDSRPLTWGLIPAAGRGERFGGELPKQLREIAGRPLLAWALETLLACPLEGLTVALPKDRLSEAPSRVNDDPRIRWIAGGETRQATVEACLRSMPDRVELVLVHDGARPAVAIEDVLATMEAARGADGAILGRPLDDTLKRVAGENVVSTLDRRGLFRAETPQVFRRRILQMALDKCRIDGFVGTDESSIVERLPRARITAVLARHPNPKLTEAADLAVVQALLRGKAARP